MTRPLDRLGLAAAAALVLPLALSGCSGDDPDPKMPQTTAAASSPSPTTSPTQDPTAEPTLPPEAEGNDEAAAEAFIRYYWDVVDYAQSTGDMKTLETLALPSCGSCETGNAYLRKLYNNGGALTGVDYKVDRVRVELRSDREMFSTYNAEVSLSNGPYVERSDAEAKEVNHPAGKGTAIMTIVHDRTGFSVANWTLR